MAQASGSRRVVIVGGGFAGLFAARELRDAPVQVTLLDRAEHHLFQPLLYQYATGILSEGKIATPLRELLERHRNVEFMLAGEWIDRTATSVACPSRPPSWTYGTMGTTAIVRCAQRSRASWRGEEMVLAVRLRQVWIQDRTDGSSSPSSSAPSA